MRNLIGKSMGQVSDLGGVTEFCSKKVTEQQSNLLQNNIDVKQKLR